jgi:hypothetical protein
MSNPQPLPAGGPSREEIARRDLGHTDVAPATVGLLLAFFLTAVVAVSVAEVAGIRGGGADAGANAWSHLVRLPSQIDAHLAAATGSAWQRLLSANRVVLAGLSGFEVALEDESRLGRWLRPHAQAVMTRWLGAGNERVYPGRDGWLFYRPDVEYVTGRPFLDMGQLRRRISAAPEFAALPEPDPRPAIARFHDDLEARGITLVVMPTPLKPSVHPEMLSQGYADVDGVLQNASYQTFIDDLRRAGVTVFDPAAALATARRTAPQYLATDTHWRPEAMEMIAELLARVIAAAGLPAIDSRYGVERVEVRNVGDAARMLDLPADATLLQPESVYLRRVLEPDGSPWRSSRDADVLLLGDSFSNIYSLESMGWGTSAGFAEQLSYALGRPVDRLLQNDEGSFATRALLLRDLTRLDGKRVVVYQFAARELAFGDWKVIPIP